MILEYEIYKKLYNFPIMAKITVMDQGCVVIIIGGSRTHTGTVSMYKNKKQLGIIQRKEHKDQYISEKWAKELSGEMNEIVTVLCGIHYENATKEMIGEVLKCTDVMLEEIKGYLNKKNL